MKNAWSGLNPVSIDIQTIFDLLREIKAFGERMPIYPSQDLRVAFVGVPQNTLHAYWMTLKMCRDTVDQMPWWDIPAGGTLQSNDRIAIEEFEVNLKLSTHVMMFSRIETNLRGLAVYLGLQSDASARSLLAVYTDIIKRLKLDRYVDFLDICRLIRNSMHNNGVYRGQNRTIEWYRLKCSFVDKQSIEFVDIGASHHLLKWMWYFIKDVLSAPEVATAAHIEMQYGWRE